MSLQFVADRIFETGDAVLGKKVLDCAVRFVDKKLLIDYVGFLLTDEAGSSHVDKHALAISFRCALISMTMPDPEHLVERSFTDLEKEYGFNTR